MVGGVCAGTLGLLALSGCFGGSSSTGDHPDADLSLDSGAFEASFPGDSASGADSNVTPEAGSETGAGDASDGGAGCGGDGGPGTFTCVGNLGTARVAAGVAALPGGKALIAGGWNATSQTLTSAEVFDSASGTFSSTGNMVSPHLWGEWSTPWPVLADGKVLAAGGLAGTGALVGTAELYDPTAGTWAATGPLQMPVISMFPQTLSDGSVLFIGGWNSTTGAPPTPGWSFVGSGTNEVQRYTPSTGLFTVVGPLAEDRLVGCNVTLPDGDVLAIAGGSASSTTETNIEQFVPAANQWTTLGTLSSVPSCTQAFLLTTGKVLLLGTGSTESADVFDPTTLTTTPTTGFTSAWVPQYAQLANGNVLAYGGQIGTTYTANAMVYSASTNAWTAVGSMGQVRGGATSAVVLTTGEVLIIGGTDGVTGELATAEVYHP
jgi:hypothetical protein